MKVIESQQIQHVGSETREIKMGLSSDFAHLMGILSSLYSNQEQAVVREYATNAWDSHIEAGVTEPIRVTLPTEHSLHFVVQDFGLGLSIDDIADTYAFYGASTKRDSDDFNGLLGVGSKSGLTYCDAFNVTAVKDGVKVLAIVTRDTQGLPTIKILDTLSTTERNGVKIDVPVQPQHVAKFAAEAQRIYKWFPAGSVVVDEGHGDGFVEPRKMRDVEGLLWLDDDVAVDFNNRGGRSSYIVMGNVAYRFQHEDQQYYSLYVWVPMGGIEFAPSREDLKHTDLTDDTLQAVTDYVNDRLPNFVERFVDEAMTPWEKVKVLAEWQTFAPKLVRAFRVDHGNGPRIFRPLNPEEFDGGKLDYHVAPAARYNLNLGIRRGRKSNSPNFQSWFNLASLGSEQVIVTDYPFTTLTPQTVRRLNEWKEGHWDHRDYLLYGEGVDWSVLEGKDNIVSWDEVVRWTNANRPPVERGPRKPTRYTYYRDGVELDAERIDLDEEDGEREVLLYNIRYGRHDYDAVRGSRRFDNAVVADIKESQLRRFLKVHKGQAICEVGAFTRAADEVLRVQREAVFAEMTDEDRLSVHLQNRGFDYRSLVEVKDRVNDPDLRYLLDVYSNGLTERVEEYTALGGDEYKIVRDIEDWDIQNWLSPIDERYPLVQHTSSYHIDGMLDDVLLYINTKYIKHQALSASAITVEGDKS